MKIYKWRPAQIENCMMSQGESSPRHIRIRVIPTRKIRAPLLIEMMKVFLSHLSHIIRKAWKASCTKSCMVKNHQMPLK